MTKSPKILRKWDSLPGMMSTAAGLMDYAENLARRELRSRGHCQSQWIVVRPTDAYLVSTPFFDGADKTFFTAWMASAFKADQQVERYAFICEAWLTEFDKDKPDVPIGRRDALMLNVEERIGTNLFRTFYISGSGRSRSLSDPREGYEAITGHMSRLFQR